MSVLTAFSHRDVHLHRRLQRPGVTVSDFSIDALISADLAHLRRRSPPGQRPPIAAVSTSHDGVSGGATGVNSPPPTPPGQRQMTASTGWASQINVATIRRMLPAYPLHSFTGKHILLVLLS